MAAPITPAKSKVPQVPPSDTPRSAKSIGDGHDQAKLRAIIGLEMDGEMLECSVDAFLDHYAPFRPSKDSVDEAFEVLSKAGHLMRDNVDDRSLDTHDAAMGEPYGVSPHEGSQDFNHIQADDNTDFGSDYLQDKDDNHLQDDDNDDAEFLQDFELNPSRCPEKEATVFKCLQYIAHDLSTAKCRSEAGDPRTATFRYRDCPSQPVGSEIGGATFQMDACLTDQPQDGQNNVVLAHTAVIMEFKKKRKDTKENRLQLISAANHIMNDDPRRMFTYGITIEDTMMSLWFFSRSHSVKSHNFDFTKHTRSFVRVLLAFLFATREEIGYDPCIHRIDHEGRICYVYEIERDGGPQFYRTLSSLFNQRVLCITGRKTRVWEAIRVRGPSADDVQHEIGGHVALKDVWLPEGAKTEKEIQDEIFESLRNNIARVNELPENMRDTYRDLIESGDFQKYFTIVEAAHPGRLTKPVCDRATPVENLFRRINGTISKKGGNILPASTQVTVSSNFSSNVSVPWGEKPKPLHKRKYGQKRQYRLIYHDIGTPLHRSPSLGVTSKVLSDLFRALVLMYIANYVHRDISPGNTLCFLNGDEVQGKLSDLEYAKAFGDRASGDDLKTGTPYFMAIEIHSSEYLYRNEVDVADVSYMTSPAPPLAPEPDLMYRFCHDLESLWWMIVWILTVCVVHKPSQEWANAVFTYTYRPSEARMNVFLKAVQLTQQLEKCLHPELRPYAFYLENIRRNLNREYLNKIRFDSRAERAAYSGLYSNVNTILEALLDKLRKVTGVLFYKPTSTQKSNPNTKSKATQKRPRSSDEYEPETQEEQETEGEEERIGSQKKRKDRRPSNRLIEPPRGRFPAP